SVPPGLEVIAAGYLDLVDVSNAATCTFNAALSQSAPALDDLKRASADYAESLIAFTTGLRKVEFPAEMEEDVVALDHAFATNYGYVRDMATADTLDAFIEADDQLIESNKASAAAATR